MTSRAEGLPGHNIENHCIRGDTLPGLKPSPCVLKMYANPSEDLALSFFPVWQLSSTNGAVLHVFTPRSGSDKDLFARYVSLRANRRGDMVEDGN